MPNFDTTPIPYVPIADKAAEVRAAVGLAPDTTGNTNLNAILAAGPAASRDAINVYSKPEANLTKTNWVCEGDSWSAGTVQGNDRETWPFYIEKLAHGRANLINVATAGQTAATMDASFSAQVEPHLTTVSGKPSIAFIFAGINDVSTNDATAVSNVRTSLRSLWTKARGQGAKVCAFTLPHRNSVGGWSQENWKTINSNILADGEYYDYIVRTDIMFSNALSGEYTDGLHVNTSAHQNLASRVMDALDGRLPTPSKNPFFAIYTVNSTTFSAGTLKNLSFSGTQIDDNGDVSTVTVGSDSNTKVFTVPIDGTYRVEGRVIVGGLTSGDTVIFSAYITPIATGVPTERRMHFLTASGANCGVAGSTGEIRLLRGDKINLAITSSRAGSSLLTNANFSLFCVRLISTP